MEKDEVKRKIEQLTKELNELVNLKEHSKNEEELNALTLKDFEISRKITKLEWQLKSSSEKQEYRKMMINISKKWGSMQGTIPPGEKKMILEFYVELYDLAEELLQKKDIPERIVKVLEELIEKIDLEF